VIEQLRTPTGDNYSYVVYDEHGGTGCIVDPVATESVRSVLDEKSLDPVILVNTHGHGDHTGSNSDFKSRVADVICHPDEKNSVPGVTRTIRDGETLPIGSIDVEVLHTPGHTSGSICLKTDEALITGDTVFLAGCGNPQFGGSTRQLFESFKNKILPLDRNLKLLPGHDYALRNLNFAKSVDPENSAVQNKLDSLPDEGEPSSTLAEERKFNPFFRYDDPELIENLDGLTSDSSEWDVFKRLRELRNQW
jgi:hydroxyacylglutathione hydrolase